MRLRDASSGFNIGDRNLANFSLLESFTYSPDGNLTHRIKATETISYEWSDYNRLLRVESSENGRLQDNRYSLEGIRKRKLDKGGNTSDWHWNNFSNYNSREPAAWEQELDFYRDLLLSEMASGNDSRLNAIWKIGADRLAAGRAAGHVPTTPSFFGHRGQVLGAP